MSEAGHRAHAPRIVASVWRSPGQLPGIFIAMTMCVVGVLSADTPCHGDRVPPELCAHEARSDLGMVATGSPEATEAAVEILERGGNAIDAAVAAALTLGVANPDASGLGGVTSLVIHLESGRTLAIDGTSNAPMAIDIEKFREFKESGRPYGYETVAVPTTLAVVEHARAHYGTRDMVTLLQPAIDFAERGFDIFTVPPPSGGAGLVLALNILETYPSDFIAEDSVERHHTLIEAFRIAAADAPTASGWHTSPGSDPFSKAHARDRAAFIIPGKTIPEEILAPTLDPECQKLGESTTRVSVADSRGNVVSLTQTLSRSFGSKVATPGLGFPYNSFLEFFNADKPQCPGYLQPNSPCETDMAPTIVLEDGALFAALGTPGSTRIPPLVAGVISNMVDRGMGVRDAVTAPRILWGGTFYGSKASVELTGPLTEEDVEALQEIGFEDIVVVRYPDPNLAAMADSGGVNAIAFDRHTGQFTGVGDPRRYGSAMGPRVATIHD